MENLLLYGSSFLVIVMTVVFVLAIVCYVVNSLALKKFFKGMGYANPNFAFIPIVNNIIMFDLATSDSEQIDLGFGLSVPQNVFKFYPILVGVIGFIPVIGKLISFVLRIAFGLKGYGAVLCCFDDYNDGETGTMIMAAVSCFVPFILWAKFFSIEE